METKNCPVYCKAEVVVCGGGTAGVFAAIAAAEQGKKVIIIEQFGSIGGSATNALVTPIMGTHIEGNPKCSYISKKVYDKLLKYNGVDVETGAKFDPLLLKIVLEELCIEAGVKLLYYTFIGDVLKEGNTIKGVVIVNKAGMQIVEGDIFIDTTGDGDVSVYAGAAFTKGNPETGKNQPISLRYTVGGIDIPAFGEFLESEIKRTGFNKYSAYIRPYYIGTAVTADDHWTFSEIFNQAIANGDLTEEDKIYWQTSMFPSRNDSICFNNPEFFVDVDGTDPEHLTKTQIEGKQRILKQLKFYKKYFKGFDNAYISEIAPMVGIRETRNITAEYVLTAQDLIGKQKFEDAICQSNYPVDIHGKGANLVNYNKPADDGKPYYEIPYRSLVVKGIDNLLVAGRCLGAEFLAESSLRVQHSVRSTGEAAGIAAAFALNKGILPRELDGKEVSSEMKRLGAVFAKLINPTEIVKMTADTISDANNASEPFEVVGRLNTKYENERWTSIEQLDAASYEVPSENFDIDYKEYIDSPDKAVFFYYTEENKRVGQMRLRKNKQEFVVIEDIQVLKEFRGKGIGTALIKRSTQWARENGLRGLKAKTQDNNLKACRFLARKGLQIGAVDSLVSKKSDEKIITWYFKIR